MKITTIKKPTEPRRQLKLGDVVRQEGHKFLIVFIDKKYGFLSLETYLVYSIVYSTLAELIEGNAPLEILEAELIITE